MRILSLFVILLSFSTHATELEELFPNNHPTRLGAVTKLFSSLQASVWQWRRDGIFERRGQCIHWVHDQNGFQVRTATCLTVLGQKHVLSFWGDQLDEKFEFVARDGVSWSLEELLSFDAVGLAPDLVQFSSVKSGNIFDYHSGVLRLRTKQLSGYEFFCVTSPWRNGHRQEVYGRCPSCSGKRYRAYLLSDERIEYRSSNTGGEITPRQWNDFMNGAYHYVLDLMASDLDIF